MTDEEKDNCIKIILKRFSSREEAITYEIQLHNDFDVAKNMLFWNRAKQTSAGFDTTGTKLSNEHLEKLKGRTWSDAQRAKYATYVVSEDTRKKLSAARKNKKFTKEHKERIGNAHRGKVVREESKLYGADNPMFGKHVTAETRAKISKAGTKFPDKYLWVHKETGEELYKTCLEMGRLFDPYKQSSSFTKIVKRKMKSIYKWTLKG
jgi:hypothetical protein